jgi:transposase InsO family protein
MVDDCSRLAYSEVLDDERAETVTAFVRRGLDWPLEHGIVTERLMTDNAWAYTHNRSFKALLRERAIEHKTTRPHRPQTNGKVERYQQDARARVGLRPNLRQLNRAPRRTDTLARALQRAAQPQRDRRPAAPHPGSPGHRAEHLDPRQRGRCRSRHLQA